MVAFSTNNLISVIQDGAILESRRVDVDSSVSNLFTSANDCCLYSTAALCFLKLLLTLLKPINAEPETKINPIRVIAITMDSFCFQENLRDGQEGNDGNIVVNLLLINLYHQGAKYLSLASLYLSVDKEVGVHHFLQEITHCLRCLI